MGWWGQHVLPRAVNRMLDNPEVNGQRGKACAGLRGTVLELGFGSGLNLAFYPRAVDRVLAVEPSDLAWRLSEQRRAQAGFVVERAGLDGQRLEVDSASVDWVLSTFTLCTIPEASVALAEVKRVLTPGGAMHFLEHGRAPGDSVARWQSRLNPVQRRLAGGCQLNRRIDELITASGLTIRDLHTDYAAGLRAFTFLYRGVAVQPGPAAS